MINKEKLLQIMQSLRNMRGYRLHHFVFTYPKTYFTIVFAAALAGYGFLVLFPLLGIVALTQIVDLAQSVPFTINTLSQVLVWGGAFIFAVAISYHILTVKFELPKGIELPEARAPKLFELIENHNNEISALAFIRSLLTRPFFSRPKFCKVLLSEQFELEILKTPVNGIPLWSKNTLVIGFPLMQTMPENYFACALQRKLIQYSKGRNMITNWLYQLRGVWLLYPNAFSQRKLLGEQIIVWFFKLYAPFYTKLSLYAAQQEELAADTMALREINDSDLFKTIQSQTIAEYFFHKIYFPMLNNFIKDRGGNLAKLTPYASLPGIFRKTVDEERFKQWIEKFQKDSLNTAATTPAFSRRMRNIGQTRIRLPKLERVSAAERYFGAHYPKAAQLMDTLWRNKLNRRLKRQRKPAPHAAACPKVRMKAVTG